MGLSNAHKPIVGFAAYSGVGKTSLLKKLIPRLTAKGVRIGLIKHGHHDFEVDIPGKDSYELRKAGASQVMITSANRRALMFEKMEPADPLLDHELAYLQQDEIDLILVEGFRHEAFPKVELFRPSLGHEPLYVSDKNIIAIATDEKLNRPTDLPVLDLNSVDEIVEFLSQLFSL